MLLYIVDIVRVGARFATCHSDAEFGGKTGMIGGEVKL